MLCRQFWVDNWLMRLSTSGSVSLLLIPFPKKFVMRDHNGFCWGAVANLHSKPSLETQE